MPLKDLEKLTVVKLRAELTARGLDSKGNKPFLIERLRSALEKEESQGVAHSPDVKHGSSDEQTGDTSIDQETTEMEEEPVDECRTDKDNVSTEQVKSEENGTSPDVVSKESLSSPNGTSNKQECPDEALPLKSVASPSPATVASSEKALPEEELTNNSADVSLSNSAPSAADDSIVAVYGGKDETFMEVSTLEQSEEPGTVTNSGNNDENVKKTSPDTDIKDLSSNDSEPVPSNADVQQNTPEKEADVKDLPENQVTPTDEEKTEGLEDESMVTETQGDDAKDGSERGEKRPRESSSPSPTDKVAVQPKNEGPPPEDEPEWDQTTVVLDWYNSDLNLVISKTDFVSATPLVEGGFAYMWAGARASYGFSKGKICYEAKVVENLAVTHLDESEPNHHLIRIGWSLDSANLQLGEDRFSYGFGGTGKISENAEFKDYGKSFQLNDVVGVYLDASEDKEVVELSYTINGEPHGIAFSIVKEKLNGQALFPHVLTKNCRFEVNFGQKEEPWFAPIEGYQWAAQVAIESRVRGPLAPPSRADCQMIMMCGLPGSGKTTWANQFCRANPDRKINIIGTNAFLDKMKVNGLPRRNNYSGRWEVLIEKCTRCLNILLEIAAKRRRNYILDQTNVYPTAQKRKMSFFAGFGRKAVVIVPTDEEFKVRVEKRIKDEGKDVPDTAVMEMKANFKLPSVDDTFSEVDFPELDREEALKVIEKYSAEAKAAGYGQPPSKRPRPTVAARGQKNERDLRRHSYGSPRPRGADTRGSNGHIARNSRSFGRDIRDIRYRPIPPPPSGPSWRGGMGPGMGGGMGRGAMGRGGWVNRGPPPPMPMPMPMPMARNGHFTPRRGAPPSSRGGWSAPPSERPSYGGGRAGAGSGRNYDDRRNERPSYGTPRRDGPSPWINQGPLMANSATPPRSPWNSQSWNNSSPSYGQSSSYGNSYGGVGGASNYGHNESSRSGYGSSGPARSAAGGYSPAGQTRPGYGPPGPSRAPAGYGTAHGSNSPWSQQTGYQQHPYNPNHSAYSGSK